MNWNTKSKSRKAKNKAKEEFLRMYPHRRLQLDMFINELKMMNAEDTTCKENMIAYSRAKMCGLIAKSHKLPEFTKEMKTIELEEQERFVKLPKEVRFAALEYYAYMKVLSNGNKLTHEQMLHCARLSAVVDEYGITPLSFESDVL